MKYVIGTRASKLAVAQAEYVCSKLAQAYPKDQFEIHKIKTKGDLVLDKPLHEIGDRGLFVTEIEAKILAHEIDIGVHSMKDMPSSLPRGLMLAKAWKRADPRDVLVLREITSLANLPSGAVIGTGSKRREFQLKRLKPDLKIVNIRGNVDTRLKKMEDEKLDGIVLAAAGIQRLGIRDQMIQYLEADEMISAPAQGVLALEIRKGDEKLARMLDAYSDADTMDAVEAERGFLKEIGGDCHIPAGAICQKLADGSYQMHTMYGNESGSRQAYACVRGMQPGALAKEAAAAIRHQIAGMVYLVGSGPGDPSLVTVKGLRTIREADCIIYDRLSPTELLDEVKPSCEMIYVGKADHKHTMKQEEINQLLLQKSMEYEKIVRLKGGDAYVFGRGGEEGLFLKEHGVPCELIPGISSCIAGPALAGIPVTHRGIASGFHVVTAHDQNDALADLDFKAMATGAETCIFLMGLSKVQEIADKLMAEGMAPNTKAAVISQATTPQQKTCIADLAHIADAVKCAKLVSPAVIVVGAVVSLREKLNFFEHRSLFGKRYLIPVVSENSTRLQNLLQEQGATVDEIQVGMIVNLEKSFTVTMLQKMDWIIFTSKHSVESFFSNLARHRLDVRILSKCKIAAIGGKTEESLKKYGLYADLVPTDFHSEALAAALRKFLTGKERVCYLKAEHVGDDLRKALEGYCNFEEISVYENRAVEPNFKHLQPLTAYDGILFTCASSAKRLLEARTADQPLPVMYSIGPKTTACLHAYGEEKIVEAKPSTYEGLVTSCIATARANK